MIQILIPVIISVVVAQMIDFIIESFKTRKFQCGRIFATGGMPSSHSAGVSALVSSIYMVEGFTNLFIVAICFSAIVLRDAIGVRQEVGKHSKFLNIKFKEHFNEKAGHTLIQVLAGILLGVLITILFKSFIL